MVKFLRAAANPFGNGVYSVEATESMMGCVGVLYNLAQG